MGSWPYNERAHDLQVSVMYGACHEALCKHAGAHAHDLQVIILKWMNESYIKIGSRKNRWLCCPRCHAATHTHVTMSSRLSHDSAMSQPWLSRIQCSYVCSNMCVVYPQCVVSASGSSKSVICLYGHKRGHAHIASYTDDIGDLHIGT